MAATPVEDVRAVFEAFVSGDLVALRGYVDPDLEWTFLDPTEADPTPRPVLGAPNSKRPLVGGRSPVYAERSKRLTQSEIAFVW